MEHNTMNEKTHGMIGNKNAQHEDEPAAAHLNMRCRMSEKTLWTKAAQGNGGLSAWASKILTDAAKKQLNV